MSELRVGTSGWQYKHWRGRFYPRELPTSRWLEHYVKYFDTVDVLQGWMVRASGACLVEP
jgi:uncharacterized protein YecE (DUF72 family)